MAIKAGPASPLLRICRLEGLSHNGMYAGAGSLDADCPIWDHVVQLFVCCEDPEGRTSHCDRCDVTPWLSMAADGEARSAGYRLPPLCDLWVPAPLSAPAPFTKAAAVMLQRMCLTMQDAPFIRPQQTAVLSTVSDDGAQPT